MLDNLISLDDASQLLGVSKSYLYKKTSAKALPFYRVGRRVYFDRDELTTWFLSRARVESITA